ncbi:hypothetical protein MPSEU_000127800 [Mayamaea pseudoterrestris]|nr:hypothetical protein MPSEU_000127800 [Mayamaea pseudoterrestris]
MVALLVFLFSSSKLPIAAGYSGSQSLASPVRVTSLSPTIISVDKSKKAKKEYKQGLVHQQDFNMICQVVMTREITTAGNLTQQEYASFVFGYCDHAPNHGAQCIRKNEFDELAIPLQLAFATGACNETNLSANEACLRQIKEHQTSMSFVGDVRQLCDATYAAMQDTGMLIDTSDMPSIDIQVTTAPSIRPVSVEPSTPVVSPLPSYLPTLAETVLEDLDIAPPVSLNTTDSAKASEGSKTSFQTIAPTAAQDADNQAAGSEVEDSESALITVAAVVALLIAKVIFVAMYVRSRRKKKCASNNDFDPYLQEHSALGSEPSLSLTFDEGDDPKNKPQHQSLFKPCKQKIAKDPLAAPSLESEISSCVERSLSLATSIFDERLLPIYDDCEALDDVDLLVTGLTSCDENNSQAGSGTKQDPIAISSVQRRREHWNDSLKRWRQSRDPDQSLLDVVDQYAEAASQSDSHLNRSCTSRSLSTDSSNTTSTGSIDDAVKQRFEQFDKKVTYGIDSLRSDLSECGYCDETSSCDSADDSISMHISRRAEKQ